MSRIWNYIRYNNEKWMSIKIYFYTWFYRMCILWLPKQELERMMGERGGESPQEETMENQRKAKRVSTHVNRITEHTLWESKCLVRAMTARKLLKEAGIHSTLYLGVGKDEGKMIAHAWLRCGQMYVTGGNGSSYAMVAKFRN